MELSKSTSTLSHEQLIQLSKLFGLDNVENKLDSELSSELKSLILKADCIEKE